MKKTIIFLLAIIMAFITTYLFYTYMQKLQPQTATATAAHTTAPTVTVIVAKQEIKKDTTITNQMVTTSQVPKTAVQPNALMATQDAIGKVALVDIQPNQMLLSNTVQDPAALNILSQKIQTGYRAVTVTTHGMADSVDNLIEPGDQVDIYLTEKGKTSLFLSQIKVLSVDRRMEIENDKDPYKPYTMVTLEVKPNMVAKIIGGQQKGKLTFDLYGATSTSKEG